MFYATFSLHTVQFFNNILVIVQITKFMLVLALVCM